MHPKDMNLHNVTAIIKTFERQDRLLRLLKSINFLYPGIPIVIIDDSKEALSQNNFDTNITYCHTEFDLGLSEGRNRALDFVQTKYFVLLDDDFELTYKTDLEKMYNCLETTEYCLVAGLVLNYGYKINLFDGIFEFENDDFVIYPEQDRGLYDGYPQYDIVHNFFMAKTVEIKKVKWDSMLKLNEHEDFFIRLKKEGCKVTLLKDVFVSHYPTRNVEYDQYRERIGTYHQLFLGKYSFNKRYKKYTTNPKTRRIVFQFEKIYWYTRNIVFNKCVVLWKNFKNNILIRK